MRLGGVPYGLVVSARITAVKAGIQVSTDKIAAHFKIAANPNLPLIRVLKIAKVEVLVCGQSLHELGFKAEEVAEEVSVADAAMLVLVNKQADGYAYIPAR